MMKKKLIIILGIILPIIVVLVFTFNGIVAGIIQRKTDTFLSEHKIKHYRVKYDRIGFNLLNRSIKLKGLSYTPDSLFIDSLTKSGYEFMVPEIIIDKIVISGIGFQEAVQNRSVQINRIKINSPNIIIHQISGKRIPEKSGKRTSEKESKSAIPDSILVDGLNGLNIDKLIISNGKIKIYNVKRKRAGLSSEKLHFVINNIKLIKSKFENNYLYTKLGNTSLNIEKFNYKTPDNLYNVTFDVLSTKVNQDSVTITNLHYKPIYSKAAFSKQIKFQKERYDIKVENLLISHLDLMHLFSDNRITIKKIVFTSPYITIYRDKRIPLKHGLNQKLPNQALKQMEFGLQIDTVSIDKGTFIYEEKTDLNSKTLYLSINNLSANITNISNIKTVVNNSNNMKIKLNGRLMGKAPLTFKMLFPLKARNDTFVFSGAVYGKVPFKTFNKAIYPVTGINIKDGTLNKMTFSGGGNPAYSQGTLLLLYNNLSLNVVKKDEKRNNKFLSWGATTLIRKNNPIGNKPPKDVFMYFERDREGGIGTFLWKTILSGLKATFVGGKNSATKDKSPNNSQHNKKRKRKIKNRKKSNNTIIRF